MDERFRGLGFYPADILLPQGCDLKKWAVVACDQYTSQPEYWQRVERCVGTAPSALHLILPESSLDGPNVETDIMDVTNTMSRYLRDGIFRTCPSALVYVERTLASGKVRRGLVGMVDLEQYVYEPGAEAQVRATDLRGGAALAVAALGAEGRSELTGVHHIDRGYQSLEGLLESIGLDRDKVCTYCWNGRE